MLILLTNDDGIRAPGIAALYRSLQGLGEIAVVAPDQQQTGVGHGISVQTPMIVQRVRIPGNFEGYAVDGRPADCVKLAMLELLDQRPKFVISGINAGINTGWYMLYSGTVAAAAEAAVFFGVPSMAVSLQLSDNPNFDRAGVVARQIFERYVAARPRPGSVINVSIPALDSRWPKGARVCPPSATITYPKYQQEADAQGRRVFRFDGGDPELIADPNTDVQAVQEGYVAITPLKFDLTDRARLTEVSGWGWPERFG
jgi:5'-nucleotidase